MQKPGGNFLKEHKQFSDKKADITKEIQKFVNKKDQANPSTKLPNIDSKYQDLANLQYVSDSKVRKELMEIIDELMKIEGLTLRKTGGHDLSVRYKGRQLAKICPLKKRWSASLNGGKIQSYTKNQVLGAVKKGMIKEPENTSKPSIKQDDKAVIKQLEGRISKLAKGSKGISIKGIKVTSEVKKWAKTNGYTLTGSKLMVN